MLWHGGSDARVVYVGQANTFRDRLADHRQDARIQKYKSFEIFVTRASAVRADRDGIERYLADKYAPLVGERRPAARPTSVNAPWD